MAAGTKLVIVFTDADNANKTFSFNYAKPDVTANQVKALAEGIITNGSIYEHTPVSVKSAKLVTTSETDIAVNS